MSNTLLIVNINKKLDTAKIHHLKQLTSFDNNIRAGFSPTLLKHPPEVDTHILNYSRSYALYELKDVLLRLNFDNLVINLDYASRLFLNLDYKEPESDIEMADNNEKWIDMLKTVPARIRNRSFFLIKDEIFPINSIYFLLNEIQKYWERNNHFPFDFNISNRKIVKAWLPKLMDIVEKEDISFDKSDDLNRNVPTQIEDSGNHSNQKILYIKFENPSYTDIKKLNGIKNLIENTSENLMVKTDDTSTEDMDPPIVDLRVAAIDSKVGAVIKKQPRLIEVLDLILSEKVSDLYVYNLNDFSLSQSKQEKIMIFAKEYNVKVHILEDKKRGQK